jgi:hypothetical protein
MPLSSTSRPIILISGDPRSVGVWMEIENSTPEDFVWVIATRECVEDLDPGRLADQYSAVEIAEGKREILEQAASAKYDAKGIDPEESQQEGKSILRIHSYDLPG